MLLAGAQFILIIVGLIVLGLVGFVIMVGMVLTKIFNSIGSVFRSLLGQSEHSAEPDSCSRPMMGGGIVCERPNCGHVNPPQARYCARCGQRLRRAGDLDEYG